MFRQTIRALLLINRLLQHKLNVGFGITGLIRDNARHIVIFAIHIYVKGALWIFVEDHRMSALCILLGLCKTAGIEDLGQYLIEESVPI